MGHALKSITSVKKYITDLKEILVVAEVVKFQWLLYENRRHGNNVDKSALIFTGRKIFHDI